LKLTSTAVAKPTRHTSALDVCYSVTEYCCQRRISAFQLRGGVDSRELSWTVV